MVQAYRADPKTGAVWLLLTPRELQLTLTLLMRGFTPEALESEEYKELLRGWELTYEALGPKKKEE